MDENFIETADSLMRASIDAGVERARTQQSKPAGFDGSCSCGEEINPRRVALGYYRCLGCQTQAEKHGQHPKR